MEKKSSVEFSVRCNLAHLDKKEIVCILGSIPELGSWDEALAVPLTFMGENDKMGSLWTIHLELHYENAVQYKYLIKRKGVLSKWETIKGNRVINPGMINLANGKASQSSTFISTHEHVPGPRLPGVANNGDRNGYHDWMCCHTKKEFQPWWNLELESRASIAGIVLWNREDRAIGRLFPVWVLISNEPFSDCTLDEARSRAVISKCFTEVKRASQWDFSSEVIEGKYIRVQLEKNEYLHFAELEVLQRVDLSKISPNELSFEGGGKNGALALDDGSHRFSLSATDAATIHQVDDGSFGHDPHEHSELELMIDEGWLTPSSGSELRITLGSIPDKHSIHLSNEENINVVIEMKVESQRYNHWPQQEDSHILVAPSRSERRPELQTCEGQSCYKNILSPSIKKQATKKRKTRGCDFSFDQLDTHMSAAFDNSMIDNLRRMDLFAEFNDDTLYNLYKKMHVKGFELGETIIHSGNIRKNLYIILEGKVEVVGQCTDVGERLYGEFKAGQYFGQMALLGGGTRTANVRAVLKTKCYTLDRNDFISVIGKQEYKVLREKMLAKIIELPTVSYSSKNIANNELQVFLVRISSFDFLCCRIKFEIFADSDKKKLLGTVCFLPNQFNHSFGNLVAPIISNCENEGISIVGQFACSYLLVNPFVHENNNLSSVINRDDWRYRRTLDVGHRGLGRSYHQVDGYRSATIPENTLTSFIVAGHLGADYIEFDVQLCKSRIPVVYHDLYVEVGLEDKDENASGEEHCIGIYDLTWRHLNRCRIKPLKKNSFMLKRLIEKHWVNILPPHMISRKESRKRDGSGAKLVSTFPTLEDVLKSVPEDTGLNIEIKYPSEKDEFDLRSLPFFEMNSYLDGILKVVFDYAKNRRIIFSCFDPDVCVMLRLKQSRYPVFFLTCGGTSNNYFDIRCLSMRAAYTFAKLEHLQGIVTDSAPLLSNPELITAIKKEDLLLFTWGDRNSEYEAVQFQKMHGVDAVISDNVGDLTKLDRKVSHVQT